MGKQKLIITSKDYEMLRLKSIGPEHLEILRTTKNANRDVFFHKETITPEQQRAWYEGLCKKDDDHMFVFEERPSMSGEPIGCLGFRHQGDATEIYNALRFRKSSEGARIGDAMVVLCSYIRKVRGDKIVGKVLADCPAIDWYKKFGFNFLDKVEYERGDYYNIELDVTRFKVCDVDVEEQAG